MEDEDLFSHKELPPPTFDPERGGESDRRATPPAHAPETERRLSPPRHLRLLLVVLLVVLLAGLAGGYGVFRALSSHQRLARQPLPSSRPLVLFLSMQVSSMGRMSNAASSLYLKIEASRRVPPFASLWPSLRHPVLTRTLTRYSF
jgi:hypothetical protein